MSDTHMDKAAREKARELCEKATPGPWTVEEYGDDDSPSLVIHWDAVNRVCFMATAGSYGDPAQIEATANLISAARTLLPQTLDALDAADSDNARRSVDDREKVATLMFKHGIPTGHGDTIDDLLLELDGWVNEKLASIPRVIEVGERADKIKRQAACIEDLQESTACLTSDNARLRARVSELEAALAKAENILARNLGHQTEKCYDALAIIRAAIGTPAPPVGDR